ncbi:MAG: type IV pilus modification PilV family protein [Acidimicrobiales bacterium]
MAITGRRSQAGAAGDESGFTLIELMMASAVMLVTMLSVAYVLTGSLAQAAYARQREAAVNLANTVIEDAKALPWTTLQAGMSSGDATLSPSADPNIAQDPGSGGLCFEAAPLDVDGTATATDLCPQEPWVQPACLSGASAPVSLDAGALGAGAPLAPHQFCVVVDNERFGVDTYVTTPGGTSTEPPLVFSVVVSWVPSFKAATLNHVVTTTEITNCQVRTTCT